MLIAGPAGGLTDRFGGKYILVGGLTLFALGMGYIDWIAEADSGHWSFLPGLIVGGVGLGFTWAPLYNVAMRDIEPHVAGVAAGVFSTIQEMGGVIAGVAVGALLQNRLAAAIQDEATQRAGQLPPEYRDHFVDGSRQATEGGLEFGTSQTSGGMEATPGMPAQVAQELQQLAEEVFKSGFADAMHPTLILPIAVVLLAAMSCLTIKRRKHKEEVGQQHEEAAA